MSKFKQIQHLTNHLHSRSNTFNSLENIPIQSSWFRCPTHNANGTEDDQAKGIAEIFQEWNPDEHEDNYRESQQHAFPRRRRSSFNDEYVGVCHGDIAIIGSCQGFLHCPE